MNTTNELNEDTDSSDDDYVPGDKDIVSEDESYGDEEHFLEIVEKGNVRVKRTKSSRKHRKNRKIKDDSNNKLDTSNELTDEEKKKMDEDLWVNFMRDTGFQSKRNYEKSKSANKTNSISNSDNETKQILTNKTYEKLKSTQLFTFAGEEVKVEKEIPAVSTENRLLNKSIPGGTQSKSESKSSSSGIGGILNQLNKKPKISTLEKSKLDWDKFKKEEKLEEELQTYNRGKDGYLEKQDFLQRADIRRFEIERELRTIERNRRLNN